MVLFCASAASARQGATVPRPGSYKGPSESSGEVFPAVAKVSRNGSQTSISLSISLTLSCDNGGHYPGGLTAIAKTGGVKFSHTGTSENSLGTYHYKLAGKFTKSTSFAGTLSATTSTDIGSNEKVGCTTGPVTFTLFHTNRPLGS